MKQMVKQILKLILWDWNFLLCFELCYKLLGYLVIFLPFRMLLDKVLHIFNIVSISPETFFIILKNPAVILLFFVWIIMLGCYLYYEITILVLYYEVAWRKKEFLYWELLKESFFRFVYAGKYKIFVLPLLVFPFTNNFARMIIYKRFITENLMIRNLFLLLFLVFSFLFFLYLFGFHSIILEKKNFFNSWKKSLELLEGKRKKVFIILLSNFLLLGFILLCIYSLLVFTTLFYTNFLYKGTEARINFQMNYSSWSSMLSILSEIFIVTVLFATITLLYHEYSNDKYLIKTEEKCSFIYSAKLGFSIFIILLLLSVLSETKIGGALYYKPIGSIKVIAHRGGALFAPENTLLALRKAIKDNADMAEIDVQQTRDGTLILLHDNNFKRTAAIDKNVWDMEYSRIRELDLEEPIPTLEEAIQLSKNKISLMIELKVTGHERDLERKTIDMIEKYQIEDTCSIASTNLNTLKRIKELNSAVKTIYIISDLQLEQYAINYIDGYSIEFSSLSASMVSQIHLFQKEVYVWTVNSEKTIRKAIFYNPNGIITDNPYLVDYFIGQEEKSKILYFLTDLFYPEK